MYRHNEIRKYCEQDEVYYDNILLTHAKISNVLDMFRKSYNGLYKWSDAKLLNKLREKWKIVEVIQEKHVQKLYANNERIKEEVKNTELLSGNCRYRSRRRRPRSNTNIS